MRGLEARFGPITRTHIVRYAGASGDFNPIHHDEIYARQAGQPSVFAHGMLSAGLAAAWVGERFGIEALQRFSVRFAARVWPGDRLELRGELEEAEEGLSELRFSMTRQDGEVVVTGSATLRLET